MNRALYHKDFRAPPDRPRAPMPWDGLEDLDHELMRLGRGVGATRLRLAEAMQALFCVSGHRELGFSSFGTWATERIERRGRWADDSRAVARGLADLPAIRAALMAGQLSWSAAELLARSADLGTEEKLLALGGTLTVRQLRRELARRKQALKAEARGVPQPAGLEPPVADPSAPEPPAHDGLDDEPAPRCTLGLSVEQAHAWAFESIKILLDRVDGTKALDAVVEATLAEAMVALLPHADTLGSATPTGGDLAPELREQLDRWRREAIEACEPKIPRAAPEPLAWSDEPLPEGALALDARCRELARELAERDLILGQLALRLFESDGWRKLGYAEASQYCHERLEHRSGVRTEALRGISE